MKTFRDKMKFGGAQQYKCDCLLPQEKEVHAALSAPEVNKIPCLSRTTARGCTHTGGGDTTFAGFCDPAHTTIRAETLPGTVN
jgi:hypothetical protein